MCVGQKPKRAKEQQDLSQGWGAEKGQVVTSATILTSNHFTKGWHHERTSQSSPYLLELKYFGPGSLLPKEQTIHSSEGHFPSCWKDPARSIVAEKCSRFSKLSNWLCWTVNTAARTLSLKHTYLPIISWWKPYRSILFVYLTLTTVAPEILLRKKLGG